MPALGTRILEVHPDFVVAVKKSGVHSAPLQSGDSDCVLGAVAEYYPEVMDVAGKKSVEGGLVHRIDFHTAGLLLFARNQEFYRHIDSCQQAGLFVKGYTARCDVLPQCCHLAGGYPPAPDFCGRLEACDKLEEHAPISFVAESSFRPYGSGRKQVRPLTADSGSFAVKKGGGTVYRTSFTVQSWEEERAIVQATIAKGYRHQVRCHLAWCGLPVVGDHLYNPRGTIGTGEAPDGIERMEFYATSLTFPLRKSDNSSAKTFSLSILPEEI